jgi:hypothetical protein
VIWVCPETLSTPFWEFREYNPWINVARIYLAFYSLLGVSFLRQGEQASETVMTSLFLLPFGSFDFYANISYTIEPDGVLSTPFWEFHRYGEEEVEIEEAAQLLSTPFWEFPLI